MVFGGASAFSHCASYAGAWRSHFLVVAFCTYLQMTADWLQLVPQRILYRETHATLVQQGSHFAPERSSLVTNA